MLSPAYRNFVSNFIAFNLSLRVLKLRDNLCDGVKKRRRNATKRQTEQIKDEIYTANFDAFLRLRRW